MSRPHRQCRLPKVILHLEFCRSADMEHEYNRRAVVTVSQCQQRRFTIRLDMARNLRCHRCRNFSILRHILILAIFWNWVWIFRLLLRRQSSQGSSCFWLILLLAFSLTPGDLTSLLLWWVRFRCFVSANRCLKRETHKRSVIQVAHSLKRG